jgi:polyisoprenoid-binding protein YceI
MTTRTTEPRTIEGKELPPPGYYEIDTSHSSVHFTARHMMISKVRGRFREFTGGIIIRGRPEDSSAEATIWAASIDTGDENRDQHLRSPDFLDVDRHPEIKFRSTGIGPGPGEHWRLSGELTVRGMSRPVFLDVEYCGTALDPWGKLRAAFLATAEIDRQDFDITWNQMLETGGFLVGRGVRIEVDVEAVRAETDEG